MAAGIDVILPPGISHALPFVWIPRIKKKGGEALWQHRPRLASAWEDLRVGVALRAGVPAPGLGRGPSVRRVHTEVI